MKSFAELIEERRPHATNGDCRRLNVSCSWTTYLKVQMSSWAHATRRVRIIGSSRKFRRFSALDIPALVKVLYSATWQKA